MGSDFQAFREYGEPTYFDAINLPWEADILVCGLAYCFGILFLSFLLIVPGIAGGLEKLCFFLRVSISLFIGASILVTNFAMTWETAETGATTKYKAGTGQEINATVGVNIGLRGVNITLKADNHSLAGETIDYNEKFSWEGQQGRQGFGPFAGKFNQEYRAAQIRGLPLPILWVAEYFTLDGEGIRWGRYYRQAGWYTHIMLWLAFPLWLLSNILFFVLLRYGAVFLTLTGMSMVIANIIWVAHRNPTQIEIPFSQTDVLEFSYGPSFWLCLVVGVLCCVGGMIVWLLDKSFPTVVAKFFGVDVLQDSESIQVEGEDGPTEIVDNSDSNSKYDTDESVPPTPGDDAIYSDASFTDGPKKSRLNKKGESLAPLNVSFKGKGSARSFRSGEWRLTKKMQRPRRIDSRTCLSASNSNPPSSSTSRFKHESSIYSNAISMDSITLTPFTVGGASANGGNESDYQNMGFHQTEVEIEKSERKTSERSNRSTDSTNL